jgi:hypothetical protein
MRPSLPSDVWFVAQQVAYFKKITVMEVLVCILYNAALYYPPIFQIRNLVKKKSMMIYPYKTNGAINLRNFCFNPKFSAITDIYYFDHQVSQGYGQVNNVRSHSGV